MHIFTEFLINFLREQLEFIATIKHFDIRNFEQLREIKPSFEYHIKDHKRYAQHGYKFIVISNNEVALLVSIGESYERFEKLVLPFDYITWIFIILCFIIAYTIKLQSFVFGLHIITPELNVEAEFFGQAQTNLPGRNFARYILMLYILFCLIIRTGYQSLQYDFMLAVS